MVQVQSAAMVSRCLLASFRSCFVVFWAVRTVLLCNSKTSRPHHGRKIPGIVRQINITACLRCLPVVACRSHASVALRQRCCATNMLFRRRLDEPNLAYGRGQPPAFGPPCHYQAVHKTDKAGDWNALVLRYAHSLTFAISLQLCIPRVLAFL